MSARVILVVGLLLLSPTYALSTQNGVGWILSQQNPDGNWGDKAKGTEYQVYITSSVLFALSDYIGSGPKNISAEDDARIKISMENGKAWLKGQVPRETLGMSAYARATGLEGLSKGLLEYQNQDGGWGKGLGFQSTPWYTASVLLALGAVRMDKLKEGANYLLATQDEEGSWENTATATSAGILALAHVYSLKNESKYIEAARKGEEWLMDRQGADGGWFDAPSTAGSILALKVMYSYFRLADERLGFDSGAAFLRGSQRDDGSWGASPSSKIFDDVHTTAYAISSLTGGLPYPAIEPKLLVYANFSSSHALEGDRVEMAVTASNDGLLNITGAEVTISMPAALGGNRYTWALNALEPSETVRSYFNVSIPLGSHGEHRVDVDAAFSQANEMERKYQSIGESGVIEVHGKPLRIKLAPSQVANGSRWNFTAILINEENVSIFVENTSFEVDGDWGVYFFENNGTILGPNGDASLKVFEASSPGKPGVYRIPLRFFVRHPDLGARWFSFEEDVTVVNMDSYEAVAMVPSRIYNVISAAILLFASAFLLNLLLGLDIAK